MLNGSIKVPKMALKSDTHHGSDIYIQWCPLVLVRDRISFSVFLWKAQIGESTLHIIIRINSSDFIVVLVFIVASSIGTTFFNEGRRFNSFTSMYTTTQS